MCSLGPIFLCIGGWKQPSPRCPCLGWAPCTGAWTVLRKPSTHSGQCSLQPHCHLTLHLHGPNRIRSLAATKGKNEEKDHRAGYAHFRFPDHHPQSSPQFFYIFLSPQVHFLPPGSSLLNSCQIDLVSVSWKNPALCRESSVRLKAAVATEAVARWLSLIINHPT